MKKAFVVIGNFDTDTRKIVLPDMNHAAGDIALGSKWRNYADPEETYSLDSHGYLQKDGEPAAGIVLGAGEYILLVNF